MIQRALMGELEPKDDRALQKIIRKKQAKNTALLMEVVSRPTEELKDVKEQVWKGGLY